MKRKLLLSAIVSVLVLASARAQFTAGVKGGINFARLSGFDGNGRTSGHIGVFLHHRFNSRWSLQPELLYSGEGQRYFSDNEERTIALGYINIPVMAQYAITRELYFEFGPQIGFLVSAEDKGRGNDIVNVRSDFSSTQVALDLGLGIQATSRLSFYARYDFGLTDVSLFDNIVDHSQVGQLGVAIRF